MRKMTPADYSYKRSRVSSRGARPTTVSMSWLEYMALVRRFGSDARGFSTFLRATALHLKAVGYQSTLSAAVRKDVHLQLEFKA